jgi:Fe2+ or Zn2+ uptake regulation protein
MAWNPATMNAAVEARLKEPTVRFTKVYPRGWHRLKTLLKANPTAARVWGFLVEQAGHDNSLVCTSEVIADELEVSVRTVFRSVAFLEKAGALVIAKVGTANAYILNPEETWKTYEEHKSFCAFSSRTLASKKQNQNLRRRLTHMIEAQKEPPERERSLFDLVPAE